jgi:hypothetical protein
LLVHLGLETRHLTAPRAFFSLLHIDMERNPSSSRRVRNSCQDGTILGEGQKDRGKIVRQRVEENMDWFAVVNLGKSRLAMYGHRVIHRVRFINVIP